MSDFDQNGSDLSKTPFFKKLPQNAPKSSKMSKHVRKIELGTLLGVKFPN